MRIFIHGAGKSGRDAWPAQSGLDALFLDLSIDKTVMESAKVIAEVSQPDDVLIAHSAGAIPTVLAVREFNIAPRLIVLLEPALYDIARGNADVERHISGMASARERAKTGDLFGFWTSVRELLFGGPADPENWPEERAIAKRFAAIEPPWGYEIKTDELRQLNVVVVTGGWNPEYEAIASVLVGSGARHTTIAGALHRPQDCPEFSEELEEWEAAALR